jgi:hypothetical protein
MSVKALADYKTPNKEIKMNILEPKVTYTTEQVKKTCLEYFDGDDLATSVVMNKYLLRSDDGSYLESGPEDMLKNRISKEFSRIEKNYPNTKFMRQWKVLVKLFLKDRHCLV